MEALIRDNLPRFREIIDECSDYAEQDKTYVVIQDIANDVKRVGWSYLPKKVQQQDLLRKSDLGSEIQALERAEQKRLELQQEQESQEAEDQEPELQERGYRAQTDKETHANKKSSGLKGDINTKEAEKYIPQRDSKAKELVDRVKDNFNNARTKEQSKQDKQESKLNPLRGIGRQGRELQDIPEDEAQGNREKPRVEAQETQGKGRALEVVEHGKGSGQPRVITLAGKEALQNKDIDLKTFQPVTNILCGRTNRGEIIYVDALVLADRKVQEAQQQMDEDKDDDIITEENKNKAHLNIRP